jgi:hypothetical protein
MGGGIVTAVVAVIKLKPERDVLVMTRTKDVVLVQSTLIDDLEQVNENMREEISVLRRELQDERRRTAALEVQAEIGRKHRLELEYEVAHLTGRKPKMPDA